jgi:sugar lactone lactonase YvrE
MKLPNGAAASPGKPMYSLVDSGLYVPQGIDVDQYRKRLFVADPDLGKLVGYPLSVNGDQLVAGSQFTVADSVQARWVAVDGLGNVYFTDEPNNKIRKVTAKMIEDGSKTSQVVYDGASISMVSAPSGIAVDNFFAYWLNKAAGTQVGSVVRGTEQNMGSKSSVNGSVTSLASNAMKTYGICVARSNIFYSDEQRSLYAVKRFGGQPVTVSSQFVEPRGCAFDGDGTVYVADKAQNAVFHFASNMEVLSAASIGKAVDFQGAYGVAMYVMTN